MKANPMTLAEHEALGQELFDMRERMVHLETDLGRRYGTTSKESVRAARVKVALDGLRSELDDQLAVDDPVGFRPSVYYPGSRHRA